MEVECCGPFHAARCAWGVTWHSPTPRPRWASVGEPVEVLSEPPRSVADATCCWMQSQSELILGALATRHDSPLRQNHGTEVTTHYASRKELNRPPDQMTSGEQARRSLRDESRCNKDFGAIWTLGRGRKSASDRVDDFDCRQRVLRGAWRIGFSQARSTGLPRWVCASGSRIPSLGYA